MRSYEDSKIPRLFQLMEERNIKATELSNATGITKGSITDWKRGKSVPSGKRLIALCNFFDVTAEYLLSTDDTETEQTECDNEINAEAFEAMRKVIIGSLSQKIISELDNLDESQKKHLLTYMKFMQEQDKVAADETVAASIKTKFSI